MDKELIEDYLKKSGMDALQADALSKIFSQMATKDDLLILEHKIEARLVDLKDGLTWRVVSAMIFLAAVMTLFDAFID